MAERRDADSPQPQQRSHERLPLQKNALLIARGMKQRPCQMKDICAGGALVEVAAVPGAESREFQRGEVILLRTLLGEGEAARPHELRARIAHAEGLLFGVAFFNPDPAAVTTLLEAARAALPAAPPLPAADAQEIGEQLGQQLLNYAAAAFGALFKAADEQLLAAAEHAHSAAEQRLFFEAATQLRKQRDGVLAQYQKELKQSFAVSAAEAGPADASALAQADKEQFEEWLVVKVMAARVEEKCRLQLLALQTRLDALGHAAPGRQRNPYAPAALCLAFQKAIAPLRFGHVVEKVLYRCLEETVLANLDAIYESLNALLVRHKVLPQLDVAKHAPAPAMAAVPAAVASVATQAAGATAFGTAVTDFDALQSMLALQQELQATATAPLALPVDAAEVKRIFAMLKATCTAWQPALEKLVQHDAGNSAATAVLALQRFADNLVQSLAQQEDRALAWLRGVELALLHTLVSDAGFFREPAHPMRRVLECLARLGVKDTPQAEAQRATVDAVVAALGRDFDTNPDAMAAARAALEPLAAALEQAIRRNSDRVCQMAEGEQRLVLARRRVQEVLDTRLAARRVPQPLIALLDAGWRDLLTTTWLRHGEHSNVWKEYLGLVDELLAIGADVNRQFDLRELLGLLKAGLEETATVNSRMQQGAIAALKPLLSGPQRLLHDVEWLLLPPVKGEGGSAEERWLQKWLERAQRLMPGDWLELQHRRAEAECLRLAWRDGEGSRFVFVNRQGLKAGDFSRHELATLMHAGNVLVRPGDTDSLVDDALAKAGYQLYERLAWQATHDTLTGLANRPELLRQIERVLDAAKRQRTHHVLAVIRLDRFEAFATDARAIAEQLVKEVAHLLGRALAPRTTVARLGDHEFALLLEECELGKAQQLISLRLGELSALRPAVAGESIRLTASAGLADITYTSDTADGALAAAALACRQAGENGGNRIQVYHANGEEQARRDTVMVWVAKLNEALEGERLALRCQRIQAIGAKATTPGYEILLGTHSDGIQDLPPGEFVQAAERYNRMLAVDRWVVEHAFQWLRDNPRALEKLGMVSINLSTHSLADAQTLAFLLDRLQAYKLPATKICFEISEAAAIANLADAADLMRELRRAGCRFALDDFGSAHASCSHLRHLPLDFVKIDAAFVRALGSEPGARTMVRAINDLAHYLGMQTIAEFVADETILAELRGIGVDYAQGYAIEKPHWLESLS